LRAYIANGKAAIHFSRWQRNACQLLPSEHERGKHVSLWSTVRRKLTQLNRVRELRELAVPPGNRLERLRGDRAGQHSIRINDQYRVCFRWEGGHAEEVEVTDYH
jgi:proteic killer suppression protein